MANIRWLWLLKREEFLLYSVYIINWILWGVFWTELMLLHSWWLFLRPCWISGTTLFYSLCAVSCVFKRSYFSEWHISASPFEASTVKTSYANYAQCLAHQRTLLYKKWNSHTHTHPCPPLCYILLGAMALKLQRRPLKSSWPMACHPLSLTSNLSSSLCAHKRAPTSLLVDIIGWVINHACWVRKIQWLVNICVVWELCVTQHKREKNKIQDLHKFTRSKSSLKTLNVIILKHTLQ